MIHYGVYLNVLLVLYYVRQSLGGYTISRRATTWSTGFELCQIATPGIFPCRGQQKCFYEISTEDKKTDIPNEGLWIGYYKIEMPLLHIGCLEIATMSASHLKKERRGTSSRECFKTCLASAFIGISKQYCYCLNNIVTNEIFPGCNNHCEDLPQLQCGDESHITVYKNEKKADENEELKRDKGAENEREGKEEDNGDDKYEEERDKIARRAMQSENLSIVDIVLEYETIGVNYSLSNGKQHGYITRDGNKYLLEFTSENGEKKKTLCKKETPQDPTRKNHGRREKQDNHGRGKKTTAKTTKQTDETTKKQTNKTTTKQTDKTTTKQTDKTTKVDKGETTTEPAKKTTVKLNSLNDTESNRLDETENENDAAYITIVSVFVVVVIVVAVVTVVFLYRRYNRSHRFDKMSDTNKTDTSPEYNYPDFTYHVPNNDIDQHAMNSVEYNYPEFSMLKGDDASDYHRANVALAFNCNEEHVYDKSDHGDAYNIISKRPEFVAMETYDHTIPVKNLGISSSGDFTYDVSTSPGTRIQYKHGGKTDNVYNTENDTYNKLGDTNRK